MVTARLDDKGRISIPANIREELGMEPGDIVFFDIQDSVLRLAKATNPFDSLIEDAIEEFSSGETMSLHDLAKQEDLGN